MNLGNNFILPIDRKILLLIENWIFFPNLKKKNVRNDFIENFQLLVLQFFILFLSLSSEPNLLVRACNQLGQFLTHRETNLRYLALESMCLLATSEFSHDAVKKHQVNFFWRFLIVRSIRLICCCSC